MPKLYDYLQDRGFPGRVADGEDDHALVEAEPEAEGRQQLDPHAVDARKEVLHSLSGSPCDDNICRAGKQRRNRAETGSHPDGNERFRHEPGLHSLSDSPTYYDTIDYGKEVSFTGNCRYDFFGINRATGTWLCMPIADKTQDTIQDVLKMLHGPNEDFSKLWIRSDGANEISAAAEGA